MYVRNWIPHTLIPKILKKWYYIASSGKIRYTGYRIPVVAILDCFQSTGGGGHPNLFAIFFILIISISITMPNFKNLTPTAQFYLYIAYSSLLLGMTYIRIASKGSLHCLLFWITHRIYIIKIFPTIFYHVFEWQNSHSQNITWRIQAYSAFPLGLISYSHECNNINGNALLTKAMLYNYDQKQSRAF